ncbi:beta and beta-prime subunits of DNA dependent RNA-polymerase [Neoconidiobolus thromboides FSU 785]|nr:beta and beta-prime subunits of DNA dependent RNA-polymerase [Neoconidiobolus thromboides FSU 785]
MKEHVSNSAPKKIKYIQFGVLSQTEIQNLSEFEVYQKDFYHPGERLPVEYGVLDRRLGISDKINSCETCGLRLADCIGHFAHIQLPLPVYHVGFFRTIITILQDICKKCSKVLLEEKERRKFLKRLRAPRLENLQKMKIIKEVNTACKKVVHCPYCGNSNGVVKKTGVLKIIHEKFRNKKTAAEQEQFIKSFDSTISFIPELKSHVFKATDDLNPLKVYQLFKNISAEDCELMGFDPEIGRPEQFLWTTIPVPPTCIRPSVVQDAGSNEDDLTVKLAEIVFTNSLIKTCIEKGGAIHQLMEQWEFLQLTTAMYITSDVPGLNHMQHNVKPIRAFCQRLKGKTGRFRGNLSGKRVDFSGRTVISPDPNLRIDQIAVPERVAKVLTYPERVTEFNKKRLQKAILNGPEQHPGANYITGKDGLKRFLKFGVRPQIARNLQLGDIVERHLNDNDIVLFNRQPSLHRLSIMAHLVKVRPWRTFRFNECVCNPYNADFDGDEMNLHVPQTEEARIEAYELMGVKNNLVTPRNGEPLIAAIQDFITASYLITKKDRFYDRSQFTLICSYMGDALLHVDLPPPAIIKPVKLWTGKQIFNVLMRPNKECNIMVNLESKCRTFENDKTRIPDMSPNDGYLVIRNSEVMCGVMDKATVGDGNKNSLFYVILRDYGPIQTAECMNRLAKLCARWLANHGFSLGISDVMPGTNLLSLKHKEITAAYNKCDELILKHKTGNLTLQAGCDEDQTLEAQISGTLSKVRDAMGQVCITELNKYNAPLTMALCGSKGSKINVCQMVACVGQQIISGSRIPDGFEDRSLPHFLKKSKIPAAKGFVQNSFYSGLTPPEFFFHAVSGREGLVDTAVKTAETGYMQRRLMKALEDLTTQYDLSVRNSEGGMVQFCYGDDGLDPLVLEGDGIPVTFPRNMVQVMQTTIPKANEVTLLPYEIQEEIEKVLGSNSFIAACNESYIESVRKFITESIINKIIDTRIKFGLTNGLDKDSNVYAKENMQIRRVIDQKCSITMNQLRKFLEVCRSKYIRAKIEPGTAVGAIGAQSIGEPGTQMTLKTFHFAGVASMNITLGVPRIKEIINASKAISTPIITCKLVNNQSDVSARIVKGRVEKTQLGDIAEFIEEVYVPNGCHLAVKIDLKAVRNLQLEITLGDIASAIVRAPKLKLTHGHVNVQAPNRIMISPVVKEEEHLHYNLHHLKRQLSKIIVNGIPAVTRAVINNSDKEGYNLLVEGYGLLEVMNIQGIVGTETTSNHVVEVEKVLGIEAARNTIIHEIQYTMGNHGMTIDPRHVMLLGDVMTFKGEVLGITRNGIAKMKDSVLMLASFEKTTDHLFDAAIYSKRDSIEGVSECIIMGIPMAIGTGLFKLIQNSPKKTLPPRKLLFDNPIYHKKLLA